MTIESGNNSGQGGDAVRLKPEAALATDGRAEGDRDLFLELLLPVKSQRYNFIRKALNFSADGDDVFQEALLKGFRYFHTFQRGKSFETWIFTVAHNLIKDRLRATVWVTDSTLLEHLPASGPSASITEDVRGIYSAAAGLKPRLRVTGHSRAGVKFILHQARKAVKHLVEVSNENDY